jgi:hypothetical protein
MTLRKMRMTMTLCDFLGRVACSCPLFGVLMPKGGEVVLVGLSGSRRGFAFGLGAQACAFIILESLCFRLFHL